MLLDVTMPKLGESVVEGMVGKWLRQPGDLVAEFEPLLEVLTDKVDTEIPAPANGTVFELLVAEGTTVKVGTVIARLRLAGEGSATADQLLPDRAPVADDPPVASADRRHVISPVAARLAREHQLDLSALAGTGDGGRVTKKDIERYIAAPRASAPEPPAIQPPPPAEDQRRAIVEPQPDAPLTRPKPAETASDLPQLTPISGLRRAIAEHMVQSKRTSPHVTTVMEADLARVLQHRAAHQAAFAQQGARLTLTAYFVAAAVHALRAVPQVNASYTDAGIAQHRGVHVGLAAAVPDGLVVPVIRDADEKSLIGLARAVNDLAERARAKQLRPGETQGGTFTITNHGVSGSLFATPIINQPQAAILGVGAVQKRVVVVSEGGFDSIAIRPMCYLSLTFDHRLLDGAVADAFLSALVRFLERYS